MKSSGWFSRHVIITALVAGVLSSLIVLFGQYLIIKAYYSPYIIITNLETSLVSNAPYLQNQTYQHYVVISFQNIGKGNCAYINFTFNTRQGAEIAFITNEGQQISKSSAPPFVNVSPGGYYRDGKTYEQIYISELEPYETGYISFTAVDNKNYSDDRYVDISKVSVCNNAPYKIVNQTELDKI